MRHDTGLITIRTSSGDEWRGAVSRSFYPLSVVRVGDAFGATIRRIDLERGVRLAEVTAGLNELERSRRLIRTAPSDDMLLLVQLEGRLLVRQHDREVLLDAGSATLCDPLMEYRVLGSAGSHQLVLIVPRGAIRSLNLPVEAMRLRVLRGTSTAFRALVAVASETAVESLLVSHAEVPIAASPFRRSCSWAVVVD